MQFLRSRGNRKYARVTRINLTVESWADIAVREWVRRGQQLGISPSEPPSVGRFLHFATVQAGGDPSRIRFTFDFYLKFVNWSLGRGVTIENRDTFIAAGKTPADPKPGTTTWSPNG